MTRRLETAGRVAITAAKIARAVPQEFEKGVKLSTLKEWPGNPKAHAVEAIVEMMRRNGYYGVVYAQRSSRRLIAGHGRKKAYKKLRVSAVDVLWLDVDDATAARIVAADNRAPELGGYDNPALYAFLVNLEGDSNLAGTGYTTDDMDILRRAIDDKAPEPVRVAAGPAGYRIIVTCKDATEQAALTAELKQRGFTCRRSGKPTDTNGDVPT